MSRGSLNMNALKLKRPAHAKERSSDDILAGITKLSKRLEELKEIQQLSKIDHNNLTSTTKHFVRNVAEVFGDGSPEYDDLKDWQGFFHGSYNSNWSEAKMQSEWQRWYHEGVSKSIAQVETLLLQLQEEQEINLQLAGKANTVHHGAPDQVVKPKVFIVHGHDNEARLAVENFLHRLGLEPIVLSDKPNMGATIMEKFEREGSPVHFAIVLLTPDDVGAKAPKPDETPEFRPRARQNAILELGYFIGKLGRSRVAALYKGALELPSDINGMGYIPMVDTWEFKLATELHAADINVNLNKLLR